MKTWKNNLIKIFKFLSIALFNLIVISTASLMIDYYVYSWTSHFAPFGCACKKITYPFYAEESYDLIELGSVIKENPDYTVVSSPEQKFRLFIRRRFNDVNYHIDIEKQFDGKILITLNNSHNEYAKNETFSSGEKLTTPDYYIRKNAFQMIEELPFNSGQKKELESKVKVSCEGTMIVTF